MHLIPNSWGSLREDNYCHMPDGKLAPKGQGKCLTVHVTSGSSSISQADATDLVRSLLNDSTAADTRIADAATTSKPGRALLKAITAKLGTTTLPAATRLILPDGTRLPTPKSTLDVAGVLGDDVLADALRAGAVEVSPYIGI